MGTIFKRGKKWGISFTDPCGKQVRKMISPYKETAQNVLKKIETEMIEGKYFDICRNDNIPFEDFAKRYFDSYIKLENRSIKRQERMLNHLVRNFQGQYLHQITALVIREYVERRLKEVKPSSVNRAISMLKSMFNRAIEWKVFFGPNPVRWIKKLPENNERCRWLTENEQARLLSHCEGITKVIVLLALKTGLRWGEIVTLKWQQAPKSNYIDFINGTIFIHESLSKSQKSRYVPLAESVREILKDFPRQPDTEYIFFNPKTGNPIGSIKQSFKTALRKAGIENFKFHDLRHTFASQLVRNRVDLYVVQRLLGHSTPKMTQRYAHLKEDHLKEAIQQLEKKSLLLDNVKYNNVSVNSTVSAHSCF